MWVSRVSLVRRVTRWITRRPLPFLRERAPTLPWRQNVCGPIITTSGCITRSALMPLRSCRVMPPMEFHRSRSIMMGTPTSSSKLSMTTCKIWPRSVRLALHPGSSVNILNYVKALAQHLPFPRLRNPGWCALILRSSSRIPARASMGSSCRMISSPGGEVRSLPPRMVTIFFIWVRMMAPV